MFESLIYCIGERKDIQLCTLAKFLKVSEIFNKKINFFRTLQNTQLFYTQNKFITVFLQKKNIKVESNDNFIVENKNFKRSTK